MNILKNELRKFKNKIVKLSNLAFNKNTLQCFYIETIETITIEY